MAMTASKQSINSLRRRGVEVPDSITREEVRAIRGRVKPIYLHLLNVWYEEAGRSLYASGLDWTDAETLALRISAVPGLGERIAALETRRGEIAAARYAAAGDESGDWFRFRPPLIKDADYYAVLDVLKSSYPTHLTRE